MHATFGILLFVILLGSLGFSQDNHRPWLASDQPPGASTAASLSLPSTIRVRILSTRSAIRLGATGPYDYMSLAGGKARPGRGEQIVRRVKNGIQMGSAVIGAKVLVSPVMPADYLTVNGRRYRGAILLETAAEGRMNVIEQVSFEEYLYGVLPKEVGADWPIEALKAQAVVSRTYMLANLATDPAQRYDVTNDVSAQVYGGRESEAPAANEAVSLTRGEVLIDAQGKPVQTFFHSSCGGRTETPAYVWASRAPEKDYAGVSDPYCREDRFYRWERTIPGSTIRTRLRHAGIPVGEIKQIKIADKSPSGRAWTFLVVSSSGKREIQGNRFRLAVGPENLRSTFLTDIDRTRSGFHFEGRGWGHGVGLCQWGARGRAKAGHTYQKILDAYYPRSTLVRAP